MKNSKEYIKTYLMMFNLTLFMLGIIIVGAATDWNGWALFGTFVAALNFSK